MILLAIDTATPRVSVSLWGDDGPVASSRAVEGRRHGEILAPAVQAVVAGSGHRMADLTAVAVDIGPGLFTGLRVGVATAQALGAALAVPAVGLTSLEVLAYPHRRQPAVVAAVVDARRHEVFRALYRTHAGRLVEIAAAAVVTPAALADELAALGTSVLAVGDGARRYADLLTGAGSGSGARPGAGAGGEARIEIAGPIDAHPDADALAELAVSLPPGSYGPAAGLRPCYLRPADVRIGWEQRQPQGPPHATGEGDQPAPEGVAVGGGRAHG